MRYLLPFILLASPSLKATVNAAWTSAPSKFDEMLLTRRRWLTSTVTTTGSVLFLPPSHTTNAAEQQQGQLPLFVKPYTKLAPLGSPQTFSNKTYDLTLTEIARRLSNDLIYDSTNQGGYFLTGDLSPDLFRDDCTFTDPTNSVSSLSQYQNALRILFDPEHSSIEIVKPLVVDESTRTIKGTIRSRGVLKFPWHPQISSYESDITYRVGDDGLIYEQAQQWSKSSAQALRESFTPGIFSPPPKSQIVGLPSEPREVTRLFDYINGRRPDQYSVSERAEIDELIANIVNRRYPWKRELLSGTWMLVYLQPGPDGGGIDRRIPFPDFAFNDNFQIFGGEPESVTNVGELFGPLVKVKVSGGLEEVDPTEAETPKRFVAHINDGQLCMREEPCLPLPIAGEGLFDGVYLGERVRIGQNLNGGGARVVQVRL